MTQVTWASRHPARWGRVLLAGPQGNDSFRKVVINTSLTREGATKTLEDTSSINKRILLSMPYALNVFFAIMINAPDFLGGVTFSSPPGRWRGPGASVKMAATASAGPLARAQQQQLCLLFGVRCGVQSSGE